ncbi:MAG: HAD-IA family hydrolase [Clostridia bacterium]|nr:HAD-IA family hydrolase [Clostridia bacterium]
MNKLDKQKIKGILIDSGYVLIYPIGANNWFVSPKFFEYIDLFPYKFKDLEKAIEKSHSIFSKHKFVINESEEIETFKEFYIETFKNLNLTIKSDISNKLAIDITKNPKKYAFYKDSLQIIPELKKHFKISLVSDAWPSMRLIYDYNNMTQYFDSLVISSELGVLKPHKLMYQTALDNLNLKPEECIFLDDNIDNCIGAKKLGITPILVSRNHKDYINNSKIYKDYINIENLNQLKDLLL